MMCPDCGRGAHKGPCEPREEKPLACGHKASHHETGTGPVCYECKEQKFARVEDKDENIVGYVPAPEGKHRLPAFIRDGATGKTYRAELDDFCTFACYREIAVTTVTLEEKR